MLAAWAVPATPRDKAAVKRTPAAAVVRRRMIFDSIERRNEVDVTFTQRYRSDTACPESLVPRLSRSFGDVHQLRSHEPHTPRETRNPSGGPNRAAWRFAQSDSRRCPAT